MTTTKKLSSFSLQDVAAWLVTGLETNCGVTAGIPSLQRGSVWTPQQIELFWDSIFRGLPFGSLVLSKPIREQSLKGSDKLRKVDFFILDGQQRCNAIGWGFSQAVESAEQILWLDLCSVKKQHSNRKYLFRITNHAHPWGFDDGNESRKLSEDKRRNACQQWLASQSIKNKRPTPIDISPYDAKVPIPLSLLFNLYNQLGGVLTYEGVKYYLDNTKNDNWKYHIINRLIEYKDDVLENIAFINNGFNIALSTNIHAVYAPDAPSLDDLEQIFQRLNRQGTPLSVEELTYSMLKTYWPELDEKIEKIQYNPVNDSRLVNMAIRVALTNENSHKMNRGLSTEQIRILCQNNENIDIGIIKKFFNEKIQNSLVWIDNNLSYHQDKRPFGIPSYLRSSIARQSSEVFSWLMWLSTRLEKPSSVQVKKIIGIALTIHWFGIDKIRAVDKLVEVGINDIFLGGLESDQKEKYIAIPLMPELLKEGLQLSDETNENQLKNWKSFWNGVVANDKNGKLQSDSELENRKKIYWIFIDKIKNLDEMLVYVQRDYISKEFSDYDPANQTIWQGHNRPWDYDHILPQQRVNATGRSHDAGDYHNACKTWVYSLGNLVALDFVTNRSKQDKNAFNEYEDNVMLNINAHLSKEILEDTFILDLKDTKDFEKSKKFVLAASSRLCSIYTEWFETLNIESYL